MSQAVTAQPAQPSQDEVFAILKNQRRRRVIRYLNRNGGTGTLREVTAEIAAQENDVPVEELSYDQRKVVYVSLYQTHVPRLEDAGVIEYDHRSGELTLTDNATDCDAHLSLADGHGDTGRGADIARRLALPLVGAANLNLAVVGSWVFGQEGLSLSWLGGTGLGVAVLLTVASWYYWYRAVNE